jgi:hypothetical protein
MSKKIVNPPPPLSYGERPPAPPGPPQAGGRTDASIEKPPTVQTFHINPVGGLNVTAEGNDRFCHAHEVKAFMGWARATIAALQEPTPLTEDEKIAAAKLMYSAHVKATAITNHPETLMWYTLTALLERFDLRRKP